jgi:hypothetical protein
MDKPFQRKGAISNAHVGDDFEAKAIEFFGQSGLYLIRNFAIDIGITSRKPHNFDLGNYQPKVLVECKSHTWTEGGNVPSAKITTWDQAMFFFYLAPPAFRKIFFILKDFSLKRDETLGQYYVRSNYHLIPEDVEIWEFDEKDRTGKRIK